MVYLNGDPIVSCMWCKAVGWAFQRTAHTAHLRNPGKLTHAQISYPWAPSAWVDVSSPFSPSQEEAGSVVGVATRQTYYTTTTCPCIRYLYEVTWD